MAKIDSSGCIRRIAWRSLAASRTRSLVAVAAIALTALMLTAMATIAGTVMDAYQLSTFRQSGGDMHGTFKNVTPEQIDVLSSDPLVKRPAVRRLLGVAAGDAFRKVRCEVGYMDEACSQGQFLVCEQGALPREGTREVACDTRVLSALGVEPKIGEQVTLSVNVGDDGQEQLLTDTFTLCGYWTYDPRAQVSQILLPLSYVNAALEGQEKTRQGGLAGRWDLNVYLQSSAHIEADMLAILERNGYQAEDSGADDYVQIGVNWAYLSAQMSGNADMETVAIVAVLLLVVVMTGYLIINNLFRIAVVGDIRSFGLLKTIGVTPKQLRRLVRVQAMIYCLAGIPLGLAAGYLVGALLAPFLCERLSYDVPGMGAKVNPSVFLVSALFAVVTVLVSPVEAVRFTQERGGGKKRKRGRAGARILPMALANLGRNRGRTVLVVLSLSLAVVLLQVVTLFISGFDMNKYLQRYVVSDFVMADANSLGTGSSIFDESIALAREDIDAVLEQPGIVQSTVVYGDPQRAHAFLTEEQM
ncbi:MAG: ABC transporter permease, partial [Elusimicrobiales bacterium]|nr:ABC transporter permease [Elusimicrobiales bacterium]